MRSMGSVSVPGNYYKDSLNAKDFFTRKIPVIAFHGQRDPVVRFYVFPVNFAQTDTRMPGFGNTYVKETTCLLNGVNYFKTDNQSNTPNNPDFATFGSYSFFNHILQPLNIPSELYVDCQALHGLDNDGPNYQSDYGTCYQTQTQTIEYIVERATVFFKNIMTNNNLLMSNAQKRQNKTSPAPTVKIFVDCRNNYNKCNSLEDNNNGCANDDVCDNGDVCPD